jgi:transketolase
LKLWTEAFIAVMINFTFFNRTGKIIPVRVIDIHTIKPIDKDIIIKAAYETKGIVTAEEHSIIGGLGGAVSELLSEKCPTKVLKVGVKDTFGKSGSASVLLKEYGLTADNIIERVKEILR